MMYSAAVLSTPATRLSAGMLSATSTAVIAPWLKPPSTSLLCATPSAEGGVHKRVGLSEDDERARGQAGRERGDRTGEMGMEDGN